MTFVVPIAAILLAILVDWRWGDPPNRLHPVVAMGHWIAWTRRCGLKWRSNIARFWVGALSLAVGVLATGAIGWVIERISSEFPLLMNVLIQAAVLKCTLSVRSLAAAANAVALALSKRDLASARQHLAYHLVSRDVSNLDESEVAAATVESVAENTSDSVIAPLVYFVIAGLPGALIYRYVNTSDAMLGYRTPDLEWLGKPAARLDDLLNLIPSRLTAVLMLLVGPAGRLVATAGVRRSRAASIWMRDHALTSSPNAGHPMSAAAGLLGVVLAKRDHYRLGDGQSLPTVATIGAMNSLLYRTVAAGVLVAAAWIGMAAWVDMAEFIGIAEWIGMTEWCSPGAEGGT